MERRLGGRGSSSDAENRGGGVFRQWYDGGQGVNRNDYENGQGGGSSGLDRGFEYLTIRGGGRGFERGGRGFDGGGRGFDGGGRGFDGGGRGFVRGGRGFDRGGRGFDRRGHGGRGRGRGTTVVRFESRSPACNEICQQPPSGGWKPGFIPHERDPMGINTLPSRKPNSDVKDFVKEINIVLNHFPVKIKFPKTIYQYLVNISRCDPKLEESETKAVEKECKKGQGDAPRMLPTELRKGILKYLVPTLQERFGRNYGIISDFSAIIYSIERLEKAGHGMKYIVWGSSVFQDEDGSCFQVSIEPTKEMIDTANLAVDVNKLHGQKITPDLVNLERIYSVLIRCVNLNIYTPMKRTDLIDYTVEPHPLGGGIVSFPGYNVLLPLANGWKPFINIEISNLAAYKDGPVYNIFKDVFAEDRFRNRQVPNERDVNTWQLRDFEKANDIMKTCKVMYRPQATKIFSKVVVKVCSQSVSKIKFNYNGRLMSVFDYFCNVNRVNLKDKNGPCLECKGNNSPKIPAEICYLKQGQSFNRRLNESQTTEIAKKARLKPQELQNEINAAVGTLKLQNNPILQAYGVELSNNGKMHEIKARVLTPPELCYGKQKGSADSKRAVIIPEDGVWDIWGHDFEFFSWSNIDHWGILNLSPRYVDEDSAFSFGLGLMNKANTRGLTIPTPCLYHEIPENQLPDSVNAWERNVCVLTEYLADFLKAFNKDKNSFVLVVLPKKGSQLYNHVKQAAELRVGILTQCVVGNNMTDRRRLDSILGNVLLKLNSKMTQVNHIVLPPPDFPNIISIFNYPTIIIGADVTHPPPGSSRIVKNEHGGECEIGPPSFAAVTASIDRTGMPYMMHIQAQQKAGKGAAEVIYGLDLIVKKFLRRYREQTKNQIPVKIIYFRDGVGEGQFQEVLRIEMSAIRRACTSLQESYQPRITFITVQKRHKTRFFMPSGKFFENAPPGTVIDTDIVHPIENDFYLLSHKGLLGTSRPTRYHVLWDDSDFSMNEIQIMAYFLCYMFVRCSRSVKIPAPTYYAHWAAKRAEVLSKGWCENFHGNLKELNKQLEKREEKNKFAQTYPMHFV